MEHARRADEAEAPLHLLHVPEPALDDLGLDDLGLGGLGQRGGGETRRARLRVQHRETALEFYVVENLRL